MKKMVVSELSQDYANFLEENNPCIQENIVYVSIGEFIFLLVHKYFLFIIYCHAT